MTGWQHPFLRQFFGGAALKQMEGTKDEAV